MYKFHIIFVSPQPPTHLQSQLSTCSYTSATCIDQVQANWDNIHSIAAGDEATTKFLVNKQHHQCFTTTLP